jgi:hypothetical protein
MLFSVFATKSVQMVYFMGCMGNYRIQKHEVIGKFFSVDESGSITVRRR